MYVHLDNLKNTIMKVFFMFLVILLIPKISFAVLINLETTPTIPRALEEVTVEITGQLYDLQTAYIYWYLNKEIKNVGVGKTTFKFKTGYIDEDSIIDVVIMTKDNKRIDKTITITPIEIDILWEADTSTPPFYKGKALPSIDSNIKFVAIPNSKKISSNKLVYTWTQDRYFINKNASGYGKNSFIMKADAGRIPKKVKIEVRSVDNKYTARKQVSVTSQDPIINIYKNNSATGIEYQKATNVNFLSNEKTLSMHMEPFYFSNQDFKNNKIESTWLIDNTTISKDVIGNKKLSLTLSTPNVKSILLIKIKNLNSLLQSAKKSVITEYKP